MASAQGLVVFGLQSYDNIGFTLSNWNMDASTDGWGALFQAETTDPITEVGYRYGARAGTPPTYSIRLEGVDTTGRPDGTDKGGGSPTAVTFTPPADATWDGLWQWHTLTNSYTPANIGEFLTITVRYSSGTVDGSNYSSITRRIYAFPTVNYTGLPLNYNLSAGTWSKNTDGALFGYKTASGVYGFVMQSAYNTTLSTTGHQSLMHFTIPADWCSTYKVRGIEATCYVPTGNTCKLVLLQSSGTVIHDTSFDSDWQAISGVTSRRILFDDTSLTALDAGTKYYIGLESVSSGAIGLRGAQLAAAADREAWPAGLQRGLVTYNGSTYTEDNTVMPFCHLKLEDITAPSGGGGGGGPLVGGRLVR